MSALVAYLIIGITGILIAFKYSWKTYQMPRTVLLELGALTLLSYQIVATNALFLPTVILGPMFIMFLWWILCTLISPNPQLALRSFIPIVSGLVICIFLNKELLTIGLIITSIGALLNCIYAFIQNILRIEIKTNINSKHHYAIGFIGNESMLGNYLLPHVFIMLYLSKIQNPIWILGSLLAIFIIFRTRCRGSLISLLISLLIYSTIEGSFLILLATLIIITTTAIYKQYYKRLIRSSTVKERLNYLHISWEQIKKTPIFGLGFNVFQQYVPELQKELNQKTNGEFLSLKNYETPYPQKCHNDYIQHILDNGILGLLFIIFILGLSFIYYATNTEYAILLYGFIGLLISGLFMHNFHVIPTNIMFWFLLLLPMYSENPNMDINRYIILGILITLGVVFLTHGIKHALFDIAMQRFFLTNGKISTDIALNIDDKRGAGYTFAGVEAFNKQNTIKLLDASIKALANFDGDQRLWEIWCNLGTAMLLNGSLHYAEHCFKQSLTYWPEYEIAKQKLNEVNNILTQINKQKGVYQIGTPGTVVQTDIQGRNTTTTNI